MYDYISIDLNYKITTKSMKSLRILKYGRFPQLQESPLPQLNNDKDQFIVRMKYAPVNPSDINFFQGRYGVRKDIDPVVGFQGSGVIQSYASNSTDASFIGRKVSVLANMSNGTHSTHVKANFKDLIFWPDHADLSEISMSWINPFSCLGLLQIISREKPQNILLSAAASQLCIMITKSLKHIHTPQIQIYGLTRSQSQNQYLLDSGVQRIFTIPSDDDVEKLSQLDSSISQSLKNKTVFLDCIGGSLASNIFNKLPKDSVMVNYGRLSGQPLGNIDLSQLYFKNKSIRGFWLNTWLAEKEDIEKESKNFVVENFDKIYKQKIRKIYPLSEYMQAYRASIKEQSKGKILLDLS